MSAFALPMNTHDKARELEPEREASPSWLGSISHQSPSQSECVGQESYCMRISDTGTEFLVAPNRRDSAGGRPLAVFRFDAT